MDDLKKFIPWIGMVFVAGSVYGVLASDIKETKAKQAAIEKRQELFRQQTAQASSDIRVIRVTQDHLKERASEIQATLKEVLSAVRARGSEE